MKYLKTYEELNFSKLGLSLTPFSGFVRWILKLIIKSTEKEEKYKLLKALIGKKEKGSHLMLDGENFSGLSYSTEGWSITNTEEKIRLVKWITRIGLLLIEINKNKKAIIELRNDGELKWSFKFKIKNKEYQDFVNRIQFMDSIRKTIKECLYDFNDIGYEVHLRQQDYINQTFEIHIEKVIKFYFIDIVDILQDALYRITNQFGVDINSTPNKKFLSTSDIIIQHYKDDKITVSNYLSSNRLIIPFIKK
jgi:hypothetical protein